MARLHNGASTETSEVRFMAEARELKKAQQELKEAQHALKLGEAKDKKEVELQHLEWEKVKFTLQMEHDKERWVFMERVAAQMHSITKADDVRRLGEIAEEIGVPLEFKREIYRKLEEVKRTERQDQSKVDVKAVPEILNPRVGVVVDLKCPSCSELFPMIFGSCEVVCPHCKNILRRIN